jgi:hypothetical protein
MQSPSNKEGDTHRDPMYEQHFFGNEKFVGKIFGSRKDNVRNFCRSLNESLECKVSIKWIRRTSQKNGYWSVRSTSKKAIEHTMTWLLDRELENWSYLAKTRVEPVHVL